MPEPYPKGIDVETLGRSVPVSAGKAALLLRVTYAPGAHIPPHTDPGTGVWVVHQGAIGFTVRQGEAVITRAGTDAAARLGPGAEVILNVGDTASYGPDNVHTSRNAGDAPAVILIGGVYAEEQPLVRPAGAAGAPA
ncbi:MAG TPA: cupin domain-containing protein, partial [Thermomicrobiales bacterium]|nr:cupin domain-containing protein [Thermomicrobiales bacterium]